MFLKLVYPGIFQLKSTWEKGNCVISLISIGMQNEFHEARELVLLWAGLILLGY